MTTFTGSPDVLNAKTMSKERLEAIFATGGFGTAIDDGGDLVLNAAGLHVIVGFRPGDDGLQLFSLGRFTESSTRGQQLEFVNRLNARFKLPRAYSPEPGQLVMDLTVLLCGVTAKAVAAAAHRFVGAVLTAVVLSDVDGIVK